MNSLGQIPTIVALATLVIVFFPMAYWYLLALASARGVPAATRARRRPSTRFRIAIPAHNEASVIADTVSRMQAFEYPAGLFEIHVVADNCSDGTADLARGAGAIVHERNEGGMSGKGEALSWLFERILDDERCDAVAVFDADTQVDAGFLRIMDGRIAQGDMAIQGRHVIRNPDQGWFPALTWAMFIVDNRFQNLGRTNLGFSAKNMGESICFQMGVLQKVGWGRGLTEDYQLRQRLLLEGIKISYAPEAVGCGEAPRTWVQAHAQRSRWLRGAQESNREFGRHLLREALKRRDASLLDGALQAYMPSYSTLTLASVFMLLLQIGSNWLFGLVFPTSVIGAWLLWAILLFVYPLLGLALERAPAKAYLAILPGPFFILWRSWLAIRTRFTNTPLRWIRTAHGQGNQSR